VWALESPKGRLSKHGIGTIEQIEQKQIGATLLPFIRFGLL